MAPGYLYEETAKWDNEWTERMQTTSTWQDNYLPNGSLELINQGSTVNNADTEDDAPESDFNEEDVSLMIEEDDLKEPEQEDASSLSTGET
jgi:hypothetical protein